MYSTDCLDRIKSIEPVGSSVERPTEVAITWKIFVLSLMFSWLTRSIVHIVCVVHSISYIYSMFGVLVVTFVHVELSALLVTLVFAMRVYSFLLQLLIEYFVFDESFSSSEILQRANNFRVCGYGVFFDVGLFRPLVALDPRSSVLLVVCFVETVFSCASECVGALHRSYKY